MNKKVLLIIFMISVVLFTSCLSIEYGNGNNDDDDDNISTLFPLFLMANILNVTKITDEASLQALSGQKEVNGSLRIYSKTLTNLNGLESLTTVTGYLSIYHTDALTNIDGLSSLTSVGSYLEIQSNRALTNIDGLSSLTSVGSYLEIDNNNVLRNIDGLNSLTSVGSYLEIQSNRALTNIDGLSSLTSVGERLHIWNNSSLASINLPNLCSVVGKFTISFNSQLCNYLATDLRDQVEDCDGIGGEITIHDNDCP